MRRWMFLFFFLSSCSCTDNVSEFTLWKMATKVEPKIEVVIPKSISANPVNCVEYPEGCLRGRQVRVRSVTMLIVEFQSEKLARKAAAMLGQYYYKNWVFDDVSGEPVLESFVKKAFNAERPLLPAEQQSEPAKF